MVTIVDPAVLLSSVHRRLAAFQICNIWKYCLVVQLPLLICGGCFSAVVYGFNVFVLDIREQFERGTNWSLASGAPVYIGSLAIFMLSVAVAIIGGKMTGGPNDCSGTYLRFGCLGGGIVYSGGLFVAAASMMNSQLWLLYVGFSVLAGCGAGGMFISLAISTLLNFKAAGCGGLGAGLVGFVFGLWPATLSFVGPFLLDALGTPNTFMLLAGASLFLCLPPGFLLRLPPRELASTATAKSKQAGSTPSAPAKQGENTIVSEVSAISVTAAEVDAKIIVVPSAVPDKLTRTELLQQRKFWLGAIGVSCIMLPGFGIKLLIGPQMYAVYQSTEATQSAASVIFMLAYGLMRLLTGLFADRCNVKVLFVILGMAQVSALVILGLCVFYRWPQGWTVTSDAIVGLCLAGSKVLMQVWCLQVWGAANSGLALGMVNMGFGFAAILGSVSAWWSLCQLQMVDGRPLQGNQPELEHAFATWLWACSALTTVGVICIAAVQVQGGHVLRKSTMERT